MAPRLSTTSYAVLGMLSLRPWTPYELTQQMKRSLALCWPTSERALYDEPERLVAAGCATVDAADLNGRARRTYSITEHGRTVLRAWLRTPPAAPRIQNEPLLRLLFADQGEVEDLLLALATLRQDAVTAAAAGRAQMAPYLTGDGPFPERAHIVALFADLQARILQTYDSWAEDAAGEVSTWPTTTDLGLTPAAADRLRRLLADTLAAPGTGDGA